MKAKLFLPLLFMVVQFGCNTNNNIEGNIKTSPKDSINFEEDWAHLKNWKESMRFPNLFPNFEDELFSRLLSYFYYGFEGYEPSDSIQSYIKVLIIRSFQPAIMFKVYPKGGICIFEAKMNCAIVDFDHIKFHEIREVPDSVYHDLFIQVNSMDFYHFSPNSMDKDVSDGDIYLLEVKDGGKYNYIVRTSPYYIMPNRVRPQQSELIEINKFCNRLIDLSGCKSVFEFMNL